jgi:hypothetical protein
MSDVGDPGRRHGGDGHNDPSRPLDQECKR